MYTTISRKVVGKSVLDHPERYCGQFLVHCSSKKFEKMARKAMDICLRVLKESNKSRFDSCSVRNSLLIISHITFRDCRLHIFPTTFLAIAVYVLAPHFLSSLLTVREYSTHVIIFDQVTGLSQSTLLSGQRKHWVTERFQPLQRKYGTTFHCISEMKRTLIHLRSCSRTIILKWLVTQLPKRTFPGFPQRISISIRTYARTEWHT